MKLYISSAVKFALDTNKLKQTASKSRTDYLFSLMNEQEQQYDEDYKNSQYRYTDKLRKEKYIRVVRELDTHLQELSLGLQDDLNDVVSDIYGESLPLFEKTDFSFQSLDEFNFKIRGFSLTFKNDTLNFEKFEDVVCHLTAIFCGRENKYKILDIEIIQDPNTSKLLVNMGSGETIMKVFSQTLCNHPEEMQSEAYDVIDTSFDCFSQAIEQLLDRYVRENPPKLE